jgi:hypothetical protein
MLLSHKEIEAVLSGLSAQATGLTEYRQATILAGSFEPRNGRCTGKPTRASAAPTSARKTASQPRRVGYTKSDPCGGRGDT